MDEERLVRMEPINVFDYEILAEERMNPIYWDYFAGGSDDEVTVRTNQSEFGRMRLRPRVLVDVSHCDTSTSVLGTPVGMPIMVAPSAFHTMAHPDGECATVAGAGAAGALMIAATDASCSLEEIARAASGPLWFQLYLYPTREIAGGLVQRAEAAGYRAIVLTVDMPTLGNRERDLRNHMTIPPPPLVRANFVGIEAEGHAWRNLSWDDVDWLHTVTSLPIVLKGVLAAEDALLALEHGVSAIIVSNHGGRQLDGCVTSLEVLPEIVEAVAGRCEIYVDGGIRRGTDVLKALALGARAVLVARPVLWGLAVDGSRGVQRVLEILHTELERAMILTGSPTLASVNRSLLKVT
jgi:isopentenyl diphosphate isomerase/L-lactate dehydrogenase-like FMN-dependent dehydrogenase